MGAVVGALAALLALLLVYAGVVVTFGVVLGLLAGLYVLTSLDAALIVVMATVALIPFGTFPIKVAFTPSLIECAVAGFLVVYLFQWMTGRRRAFYMTPPAWGIIVLLLWMLFAYILGMAHARPTPNNLKTFVGLLMSISMALILADVASDVKTLRRVGFILLMAGAAAGGIGVVLWLLPNDLAEQMLNRLGRFGYPVGGVIRYREDGVQIGVERAIGTWIDPNAYGGFLLMVGGLAGAQLFAAQPITRWRSLAFGAFGAITLALFLSDSRGSALGLLGGLALIAVLRYRRLFWWGVGLAPLALLAPPMQRFLGRLIDGFTAADLETQMRLGEYKDALTLIQRHPVFGVGFTGVPEIDLYVGFSSTYLTLAAYAGIVGALLYVLAFAGVIGWGLRAWAVVRQDARIADLWLGLLAGIVGALLGGVFDHFYFNPQFQATSMMLWSLVGLFLAATRLAVSSKSIP